MPYHERVEPGKRVFSEQEVAEIMRRAATLQEESADAAEVYTPGVTMEELQRVAQEMGVSAKFLEQAIREKLGGEQPRGIGKAPEEQRVIEGELDPQDFDVVLDHIRTRVRSRNQVAQVGRSMRGQVFTSSGMANLEVTSRGGRTRISVQPVAIFEYLGSFYPAFIVSILAGAPLADSGQPLLGAGIAVAAFGAAALVCRTWLGKSRQAAAKLADKLQGVVSGHLQEQESVRSRLEDSKSDAAEPVQDTHKLNQG